MTPRLFRTGIAAAAAALACAASAAGSAHTARYGLAGVETRGTTTVGTFVGGAVGADPSALSWKAVVIHTPLVHSASGQAAVTGGTVSMRLMSNGGYRRVVGPLSAGTIAFVPERSSTAACGRQVFAVDAAFTVSGQVAGELHVSLTHHRRSLFGRCTIYAATVRGTLDLAV
jgi:hypothetical protein